MKLLLVRGEFFGVFLSVRAVAWQISSTLTLRSTLLIGSVYSAAETGMAVHGNYFSALRYLR